MRISIIDENDNVPRFTQDVFEMVVQEDVLAGREVRKPSSVSHSLHFPVPWYSCIETLCVVWLQGVLFATQSYFLLAETHIISISISLSPTDWPGVCLG